MADASTPFRCVAVLGGGGLMGHGIALACLQGSDAEVRIISRRQETVAHGLDLIKNGPFGLGRAVERDKITAEEAAGMWARLSGTTDQAAGLDGAELVFESIPEVVSLKQDTLADAERHVAEDTVFATNTSAIMIAELGARMAHPERLVGTHWFYPSNVMPLVEVARSDGTAPAAVERTLAYLRAIGKKPVSVQDSPGFFMTRFINTYIAEAIRLVELGVAGPAEVDEMVKTGLGWPMGVFELLDDAAAFDSFFHAQEYLEATCGERYAVPALARKAFEAGYLGTPKLKPDSKGGWYDFLGAKRPDKGER
ncbi:MAG: 3-hydroxyacyl-CoA dehydrogenase family protein [Alphaproteobacteria bacterium]|nr:3-hydroxyacyl-CoA dehydrogenase family protein [Alphaproteobacteria bacterium]